MIQSLHLQNEKNNGNYLTGLRLKVEPLMSVKRLEHGIHFMPVPLSFSATVLHTCRTSRTLAAAHVVTDQQCSFPCAVYFLVHNCSSVLGVTTELVPESNRPWMFDISRASAIDPFLKLVYILVSVICLEKKS